MSNPTVGIAGCGTMGLPMARKLYESGYDIWGFDVRPVGEFGDFQSRMISDPTDFAARVDTVISVVRDLGQTIDLCFGAQAIFRKENRPNTFICSSTLSPRALPEIANQLPTNVTMIDAPMSGAPGRAEDGTLTFMIGGNPGDIEATMPLFKIMGSKIHHLGPIGHGMTCKVINNFVAVSSVVTVRNAIAAAKGHGMAPKDLLNVMRTSSGGTWYGDNIDLISWSREPYDPGNTIGILEKDMLSFMDAFSENQDSDTRDLATGIIKMLRNFDELKL